MRLIIGIVVFAFGMSFVWGMFLLGRKINYAFAYEGMVRQTVTTMVKDSCLK